MRNKKLFTALAGMNISVANSFKKRKEASRLQTQLVLSSYKALTYVEAIMKHRIKEQETNVDIEIEDLEGKQKKLLEAFQECKEGRCTCPTREYEKLDSLYVESGEDKIRLRLKPKPGKLFDRSELDKCMQHTIEKTSRE